jgi:hypothetical protein
MEAWRSDVAEWDAGMMEGVTEGEEPTGILIPGIAGSPGEPMLPAEDGPPWTQLDLLIESRGSIDANISIARGDVRGQSAVRGVFDGFFGGFLPGPTG